MINSATSVPDSGAGAPGGRVLIYVRDKESEGVIRQSLIGLGVMDAVFKTGGIETATADMANQGALKLLIVDAGDHDPLDPVLALLGACSPATGVIVLGESKDLGLYRRLRDAGVAEYIFKPLVSSLVSKACSRILTGAHEHEGAPLGQLITVLGVRGGVGATTIAVRMACELAALPPRPVVFVDLQVRFGDAALQLDVSPNDALEIALQDAGRVDPLFVERGVIHVTDHLDLMASLTPLDKQPVFSEEAVLLILEQLQRRYRYVLLDVPAFTTALMPRALQLPATLVLVSDGRLASARDIRRWREVLGPGVPNRSILHILNRHGSAGDLPMEDFIRAAGQAPDAIIPYARDIGVASNLGIRARPDCPDLQRALAPLLQRITGQPVAHHSSLLARVFG